MQESVLVIHERAMWDIPSAAVLPNINVFPGRSHSFLPTHVLDGRTQRAAGQATHLERLRRSREPTCSIAPDKIWWVRI